MWPLRIGPIRAYKPSPRDAGLAPALSHTDGLMGALARVHPRFAKKATTLHGVGRVKREVP
jgi:hypothetical protein